MRTFGSSVDGSPEAVDVAFVGAGNMATALALGLVRHGWDAESIAAADPDPARRAAFATATGVPRVLASNQEVVRRAGIVLLAVKPQVVDAALAEIAAAVPQDGSTAILSIAAGIPTTRIENAFRFPARVVRAMPNTPALLGAGAAAVAPGRFAGRADVEDALEILGAVGEAVEVPEALIDAVTAVSGSGPAYVFLLAEAMQAAGRDLGLPAETAERLVAATIAGAGRMLREAGEDAATLRARVTSPGGTTEAALRVLAERGVPEAFREAIAAAARRSAELGR